AGGSGTSGASGTGGALALDSGGGGGASVVPTMEEPQGTALNIPCDALLGVNGSDLLILLPTSFVKIGPGANMTAPVVTAPSNYFQGAHDFAVDGTTLFWSNYQSIQSMSFSGGTPAILPVSNKDVISGPEELAVQGAYVYFSRDNDGNLYRVATDGKTPDQQVGTFPMARKGTATNGIAWIGDRVYWGFDELVMSAPLAGGGASTIAAQASKPYATLFGATGTAILWGGTTEGFVRTTLPADKSTLLANPIDSRIGAFDGTTMFGVRANAAGNPRIVSVPAAGGAVTEIAAAGSQRTVKQLLVTTQHIYWTATRQCATPFECPMGTCEARRVSKP
ncbi:MAG TPA: hypothetical protein VGP93_12320, partial [Polyangiaceae bacterium]|nr:hypothetical protein [Polyangiaceae bacterium]